MTSVRELLRELDLGKSVAEFDDALENYFVETETFRSLVHQKVDIVAGDKGTGKTAIYRILQKRFPNIPQLKNIAVVAAFNPSGNPVFQKLGQYDALDEGEYIRMWKAYILSLAGNWLLAECEASPSTSMNALDKLLRALDLRDANASPENIFVRTLKKIGGFFTIIKSAEIGFSATDTGIPIVSPKIEFDRSLGVDQNEIVVVESALRLLNNCLEEANTSVWVAIDRLDEAFQGFPKIEIPALRALLRSYLDLLEFDRIKLKLFVRRDLFRRITQTGFVNLTHVNARKVEVRWDEEDLLNLLCRRIRENKAFCRAVGLENASDKAIFRKMFPLQVDFGKRKPQTWTWIMRRIRDGNDIKPPRNLIDLISMAQQAQTRREERESRDYKSDVPIIESDALRGGLEQLSETRVIDTLLAEAGASVQLIEKFRGGKAEHNVESLAALFGVASGTIRGIVKPLVEIGFLEEVSGAYKVPTLYREGLQITQGKAFQAESIEDDDDA